MKKDIYQEVTDSIIDELEKGTNPWACPWVKNSNPFPVNHNSQNNYTGINILILYISAMKNNFSSNEWLTFKQAQALGGYVRKNEKSTRCIFYKSITVKDKSQNQDNEEKIIPMIKPFNVFNLDQIEGIELPEKSTTSFDESILHSEAEKLIKKVGAEIHYKGDKAFYSRLTDVITMPEKSRFHNTADFYSTQHHELGHWSGNKSRLDRVFGKRFGDFEYAMEELIAELISGFINANFGIKGVNTGHASYISDWLKMMKADKTAIFSAAKQAYAGYDYLCN